MKIIILAVVCLIVILGLLILKPDKKKEVWETTPGGPFVVKITDEEIICEHPQRKRESIHWDRIVEIRLVTTDEGPFAPDMWYLFVGDSVVCSVPSEAKGFDQLWNEFDKRFKGLDYHAIINAGTDNSEKVIWKK